MTTVNTCLKMTQCTLPPSLVPCLDNQKALMNSINGLLKPCQEMKTVKKPFSVENVLMRNSPQMICFFLAQPVLIALIHGVTSTVDAAEEQQSPREMFPSLIRIPKKFLHFKNKDLEYASQELKLTSSKKERPT
jgi:hypothetical protein